MEQKIAVVKQYIFIRKKVHVNIIIRRIEGTDILDNDDLAKLDYAFQYAMSYLNNR